MSITPMVGVLAFPNLVFFRRICLPRLFGLNKDLKIDEHETSVSSEM